MEIEARKKRTNPEANKLSFEDRPVHDWYRFVLSFPPHLVRDYIRRFGLSKKQRLLDPFCGTGTTVVESKKLGIPSVGVEANPMAHFASQVKVDWSPDPEKLLRTAERIAQKAEILLGEEGIDDTPNEEGDLFSKRCKPIDKEGRLRTLPDEILKLLLTNSISPLPLHKTLVLLDCIGNGQFSRHHKLALAKSVVFSSSNLHFGPEVGIQSPKLDASVIQPWLDSVRRMSVDLKGLSGGPPAEIHHGDARIVSALVEPNSIDAVITSPPYPNEKDYTRTTRLEAVLLGFFGCKDDIRSMKKSLVRSNTRSVYVEDTDHEWVKSHRGIQKIASQIESRRIELGKTSGFERLYHKVTKLYFGGMARHLADIQKVLRPGAQLAYVVGDQASYLRVMIRTGKLLGEIAEALGYELVDIDLFRTRLATATKDQLREEVVILRWPG